MWRKFFENPFVKLIRERWLTIAFVLGFCTDLILLNKIDDLFDSLMLLFYASLATVSFLLFYVGTAERVPQFIAKILRNYSPTLMQYAFGGLLSGMLIFYGRSSDWFVSGPFLLLIIAVILGNEFVHKKSNRLIYHLALYFIGVYAYVVLMLPVVSGHMGRLMFFLSGVVALIIVTLLVQALYKIVPRFMEINTSKIILTIGFIYIGFNVLYFTNIIPPIPLSLTKLEVVHSVEARSTAGTYRVVDEEKPWWNNLLPFPVTIHPSQASVACFASVYAPTRLTTDIFHHWEYKDADGKWVSQSRIPYPIASSGTEKGYRGYSYITKFSDGLWRCGVETENGQVLGRKTFIIDSTEKAAGLVTRIE